MTERQLVDLEDVTIERLKKRKSTRINILVGGKELCLSNMRTSSVFYLRHKVFPVYIVAYSTDCEDGKEEVRLEGIYDRKNKKLIQVTKENRKKLEYMTISKKMFYLSTVLEYLNEGRLNAASLGECIELEKYLTSDSEEVSRAQVKEAIIKAYPLLQKYTGYDREMKLEEYKVIAAELGTEELYFNIIPNYFNVN